MSADKPLTFGSLFAGIGGFDLGFERAGMVCKWQVEIDEFARKVLAKHWPDVRRHDDVRTFPNGKAKEWEVDVICGGFPCQDISYAGKGAGIDGERSGLWSEYARIVRLLRPRYVVVENVPALLARGLGRVLGDLAQIGYDAEWDGLPACEFGADHERDRTFIVAYPTCHGPSEQSRTGPDSQRSNRARNWRELLNLARNDGSERVLAGRISGSDWPARPGLDRAAYGVPRRVDRITGLGNAVVPQVAHWIGRRLIEAHTAGGDS